LHYVTPIVETIIAADIRLKCDDVNGQTVTTRDNVSVRVDSVLYWRIVDPFQASFLIADVRNALLERTQTTLRHVLGSRLLQEIIENREGLAHEIEALISGPAQSWGVHVEGMLVKDIIFSVDLQETLSSAAKAKRTGEVRREAASEVLLPVLTLSGRVRTVCSGKDYTGQGGG
jgi:regulator of protease activity HflC (stomatin/prohibitin superfamily)